jgi:hypothetical protein
MGFIQPCFIRKNTPELRKKLEELGYNRYPLWMADWNDDDSRYVYLVTDVLYYTYPQEPTNPKNGEYIDCGDNEELFLALAALRDDTDINQWFVYNSMDCIIEKLRTIDWFVCEENSIEDFAFYDSLYLLCHKATVEEIIEHFKKD